MNDCRKNKSLNSKRFLLRVTKIIFIDSFKDFDKRLRNIFFKKANN